MLSHQWRYRKSMMFVRTLCTNKKQFKSSKLIRKEFLDYFIKNLNHVFIRSSPVVPLNDPTIPFVNAGMNQFKGILLGEHSPPALRITNSQKCIRIGGKHNDLDIIGHDSYHHSFFEMLGNWSFGDYFKEDACKYAYNLLVKHYGIKKEFLYITYFGGNEKLDLKPDLECKEIWLNIGVPEDHILPFGMEDNFWEMGPTGPCGPCTEIHIDHTMQFKNQSFRVNKGHDDLTEIWNIVFIQYQRLENGEIVPLSKQYVDTGMGFERLVSILQGKRSNYDTDLFQPLFEAIEKYSHAPKYQGKFGVADKDKLDSGYRILSDHVRMITVALADGMLPDKNHKLRRILRKAIDISENTFKSNNLVNELTNHVASSLGDVYPEINKNLSKIKYIIKYEEEVMKSSRHSAINKWKKVVENRPELSVISDITLPGLTAGYLELQSLLKSQNKINNLPGDFAYKLYDTYGLNQETIYKLAEVEAIQFNVNDFKEAFNKAKLKSRITANILDKEIISGHSLNLLESLNIPKTDDSLKYNYIYSEEGYNFPPVKCKLLGMVMDGNLISESGSALNLDESQNIVEATVTTGGNIVESSAVINTNAEVGIILDRTSAYAPAGSQISDKGVIYVRDLIFNFDRVRKIRNYVIHIGHFVDWNEIAPEHEVQVGDDCTIIIDKKNRVGAMRHHTATHLLNAALQKILPVVGQRGSNVYKDSLELECSVFGKKLSINDVIEIENCINETITADAPITTKTVNILQMLKEDDLTVIVGEVYPDSGIRIVEIKSEHLNSKEACCGTHVHKTGVLEHFCITNIKSQGSISLTIKAVAGPIASLIRFAGDNLKERVLNLEKELTHNNTSLNELESKVGNEIQELLNKKKRIKYPYIIVQDCVEKLNSMLKTIKIRKRNIQNNTIEEEIRKLLNSSSLPFVVHCLQPNNTLVENVSLKNIIKLCPDTTPILIIVHCKNKIKAQSFVPKTPLFNAKIWMDIISQVFQCEGQPLKDEDPNTLYCMPPTIVSNNNFQALIDKAIVNATNFATTCIH